MSNPALGCSYGRQGSLETCRAGVWGARCLLEINICKRRETGFGKREKTNCDIGQTKLQPTWQEFWNIIQHCAFLPLLCSVTGCGWPRKGVTLPEEVHLQLRQALRELTVAVWLLSAFLSAGQPLTEDLCSRFQYLSHCFNFMFGIIEKYLNSISVKVM